LDWMMSNWMLSDFRFYVPRFDAFGLDVVGFDIVVGDGMLILHTTINNTLYCWYCPLKVVQCIL
jgi:hypothetical protein